MHVTLTPDATFNVTVKVTKNYDTRREEQESVLSALVQSDPAQMGVVGDLLFKYNDGPGHEELESRYKAVLVPPVQALLSGKQGPDPQLQQTMQENAQLKQMIQSKLAEEQAKGQITIAVEQGKAQARLHEQSAAADADLVRAAMDNEAKIEIAKIGAGTQLAVADLKSQLDAAKLAAEQLRTIVEAAEEHRLQKHDHAHEAALSMVEHAQAKDLASHQAAVAPKPEAGAGA
jgi:hypothetical protein